jgi:hypothetical protein
LGLKIGPRAGPFGEYKLVLAVFWGQGWGLIFKTHLSLFKKFFHFSEAENENHDFFGHAFVAWILLYG